MEDLINATKVMAETNPEVVDRIDFDKAVEKFGDIWNQSDILRGMEDAKKIRQAREEQAQTDKLLEQLNAGGEGAQKIIDAVNSLKKGGEPASAGAE